MVRNAETGTRFPKLGECAHFHYDMMDLGVVQRDVGSEQAVWRSSALRLSVAVADAYLSSSSLREEETYELLQLFAQCSLPAAPTV
ncbi:hypothetical protein HPB51_011682 [Rhipicephalus microplus]|uniref:Uncharacterized protein n=1 Tax=Rhipicephalus microplus TaxID=6941 RepID=A0A9J6DM99_RHIMP|nr:hypothetical protein HPB51_011682 [Rhipicephalus microplus]